MLIELTDDFAVSPQISVEDVRDLAMLGIAWVVNNRPDGEEIGMTPGAVIEMACRNAGIGYTALPIGRDGFSRDQIAALDQVISRNDGAGVLAYCRSGSRSTHLWALTMAKRGLPAAALIALASKAGFDLTGLRGMLDELAAAARPAVSQG